MKKLLILSLILIFGMGLLLAAGQGEMNEKGQKTIRLVGATHLPADYVFYRMMEVFSEKVQEYYDGPLEVGAPPLGRPRRRKRLRRVHD